MFWTCQFPSTLTDEKECASHKDRERTDIARERMGKRGLCSYARTCVCVCVCVSHLRACLLHQSMHVRHGFWPYFFFWYIISIFRAIAVDSSEFILPASCCHRMQACRIAQAIAQQPLTIIRTIMQLWHPSVKSYFPQISCGISRFLVESGHFMLFYSV